MKVEYQNRASQIDFLAGVQVIQFLQSGYIGARQTGGILEHTVNLPVFVGHHNAFRTFVQVKGNPFDGGRAFMIVLKPVEIGNFCLAVIGVVLIRAAANHRRLAGEGFQVLFVLPDMFRIDDTS